MSDKVGKRIRDVRERRGLSVKELAARCREQGVSLSEQAIYNIENGRPDKDGRRRRNVTVDELLALAAVLDVAPVHLLVPVDAQREDPYAVTPGTVAPSRRVRDWIRGMTDLPVNDLRGFYSEVPADEWGGIWVLIAQGEGAMPPAKSIRRAYTGYGNPHLIGDGEDGQG